jgi:hypothetical protein
MHQGPRASANIGIAFQAFLSQNANSEILNTSFYAEGQMLQQARLDR